MPAVRDFPKQTNPQAFDAGLILQSKPEIDVNPAGLEQGTLRFLCRNRLARTLKPARGTPCPQFIAGDDLTGRILKKEFDYLGAQTLRFIRNGSSPGIGILEIMCQGAIFPPNQSITSPFRSLGYTPRTLDLTIYAHVAGYFVNGYGPVAKATLEYQAIDVTHEYVAKEEPKAPLFQISGEWALPNADPFFPGQELDHVGDEPDFLQAPVANVSGTSWSIFWEFLQANGGGTAAGNIIPRELPFKVLTNDETVADARLDYRPWLRFKMEPSRLDSVPAGQYFHVTETGTIAIAQALPGLLQQYPVSIPTP